jgi:tetratricopeptide (TPR) repeat protein/transglutaminase-like putative cysteine protease
MNLWGMAFLCALSCPALAATQVSSAIGKEPKSNTAFSREPFVIERYVTIARFENDGTSEEDLRVRVRVESDAGVESWSALAIGYNAATEAVEVRYVRLEKPDGTTVPIAGDAIQDRVAATVRDFPAYSDYKEKQISIRALAPGDTLEYDIVKRATKAVPFNEFWFEHRFVDSAIVLDERLEINVSSTRKVTLKSSTSYETEQHLGRTIYRWKRQNLKLDELPPPQGPEVDKKPADVQLTAFASWNEVARWYAKLAAGSEEPTPAILAKSAELTEGQPSDLEKAKALYNYVAKKIRYVDLPFGAAGYRPHTPAVILANQYGDSLDKHTLLVALLRAAGMPAEMALLPSLGKLDTAMPSPAQFDRAITVAPVGRDLVWMNPTMDVVPFRLLQIQLRNKSALLVSRDGSGRIVQTPADPPFLSTQHVDIEGEVSELGKLTANAHYAVRGDAEIVLRAAFHRAAETQWKEIGQTVLTLDGIRGEVTSVKPDNPTATDAPFELDIDFTEANFIDWSSQRTRTSLPLLAIGLPDPPSDKSKPISLGSPLLVTVSLRLHLPPSLVAQPPVGVAIAHDYAEFKASYRYEDHLVTALRSLDFKMRELPPSRAGEYAAFTHAVAADQNQPLTVENVLPAGPAIPLSATADDLIETGRGALTLGNVRAAIPLLERAVQLEPQHKQASNELGLAYLAAGNLDGAVRAFQKQLQINPSDEHANDYLGLAYERKQDFANAAAAFRKQTQMNPLDDAAHASLGDMLLEQHDDAQAVPELEKATILAPKNAQLEVDLGRAYAGAGKNNEAVAAFEKAAALSRSSQILNEVAFNLAEQKLALDKAERYAEVAIADTTTNLRSVDLAHVTDAALGQIEEIAAYWDTLGWIYFQRGDPDRAIRYIEAAWVLSENGEAGDHLAQIYEKSGDRERAVHACALALAAPHAIADTRARLTLLLGGNATIDELVNRAKPELEALRTIPAGKLLAEDARADFLVLLSPGDKKARVDGVKFISGSEALRTLSDRLRSLDYGVVFPDAFPTKVIRRGTLSCSRKAGDCGLVLLPPEQAHSSN